MKSPLVILAAAKFEAAPLLDSLANLGIPHEFYSCGIGPLHAAKALPALESALARKHVVYVGTCGSFQGLPLLSHVTFRKVIWSPVAERMGLSASIEGVYPPLEISHPGNWSGLPEVTALSSESIGLVSSFTPSYLKTLGELPLVENLEAYPCAQLAPVCASFTPVFTITNEVGLGGRVEWRENFKEAAHKTSSYLTPLLAKLLR